MSSLRSSVSWGYTYLPCADRSTIPVSGHWLTAPLQKACLFLHRCLAQEVPACWTIGHRRAGKGITCYESGFLVSQCVVPTLAPNSIQISPSCWIERLIPNHRTAWCGPYTVSLTPDQPELRVSGAAQVADAGPAPTAWCTARVLTSHLALPRRSPSCCWTRTTVSTPSMPSGPT